MLPSWFVLGRPRGPTILVRARARALVRALVRARVPPGSGPGHRAPGPGGRPAAAWRRRGPQRGRPRPAPDPAPAAGWPRPRAAPPAGSWACGHRSRWVGRGRPRRRRPGDWRRPLGRRGRPEAPAWPWRREGGGRPVAPEAGPPRGAAGDPGGDGWGLRRARRTWRARRSQPVRRPHRRVVAVGHGRNRNGTGARRGPGTRGDAGDLGEPAVGGAGQLLLDGDQGQPPGLEALDGDELEQVPGAVQRRPAAVGDRTVDQADGRVPADGPPVRDGADPAAWLAVVVDGQRHVDPLGELVKGPAWLLHAVIVTVSYDSVKWPPWRRR